MIERWYIDEERGIAIRYNDSLTLNFFTLEVLRDARIIGSEFEVATFSEKPENDAEIIERIEAHLAYLADQDDKS